MKRDELLASIQSNSASMQLTERDLQGTVIIRDCLQAGGGFLLLQLLKTALGGPGGGPDQRHVVLLAAQHAASHYALVLRKAGLGLAALVAAGRLTVLDLLPSIAAGGSTVPAGAVGASLPSLRSVHAQLAAAVAAAAAAAATTAAPSTDGPPRTSSCCCLLVDDLAVSVWG